MAGEEGAEKKRAVTESLGWLTESSIMPKKHRAIEGVGVSSLLELKAQLYKSQEDFKKSKELSGPDLEYQRAKNKISTKDSFSVKNRGVDARAHKDKLELKAVRDGSVSYAALEKKAQLYDKLVNGELSDEEDQEKYCVDFFRKGIEQDELPLPPPPPPPPRRPDLLLENEDGTVNGGEDDDSLMFNVKSVGPGRTTGARAVHNADYKRNIREVHEEVNRARVKASEIKVRRQQQVAAHREKLKQAYLRKKLEQLKASSIVSGSENKET